MLINYLNISDLFNYYEIHIDNSLTNLANSFTTSFKYSLGFTVLEVDSHKIATHIIIIVIGELCFKDFG